MVVNFLPVLDNFELAEKSLKEEQKKDPSVQGLLLIEKQIRDFLKNLGVEEIKSVGEKFDPQIHDIVDQAEEKGKESGIILEEFKKGYKINGRLLRPAMVKVVK